MTEPIHYKKRWRYMGPTFLPEARYEVEHEATLILDDDGVPRCLGCGIAGDPRAADDPDHWEVDCECPDEPSAKEKAAARARYYRSAAGS